MGLTSQIERVQCRFTRKLFGQAAPDYDMRLRELGVLSLASRIDYLDLIQVFKHLHGMIDTDIARLNVTLSQNNTRAKGVNLVVNTARSVYVGKTFCFHIANLCNSLPVFVKNSPSLTASLKTYILIFCCFNYLWFSCVLHGSDCCLYMHSPPFN